MRIIRKHELLSFVGTLLPQEPIIVEAGAYNGRDTKKLARHWPQGTIHAFEPVPDIMHQLQAAVAHERNVHCYPYALSAHTGHATFYVSQKPTLPGKPFQAGSLHKPTGRLAWSPIEYPTTITVPTITLDDWAVAHAIAQVDFLWLDVQGHALAIMQASPTIMRAVKVLYLEIEFKEAYEGQPSYHDVIAWLERQGFVELGRDFEDQDRWFYGNMLFGRYT